MKKAFDQNISRARPRVRLGAVSPAPVNEPEPKAEPPAPVRPAEAKAFEPSLTAEVKARVDRALAPKPTAVEAVQLALKASVEAPRPVVEVQNPPVEVPEVELPGGDPELRRERLKERLRAVRENPRPEPLPPTVAEAGVVAVERISSLQAELSEFKALNLALTQDLEGARRQSEKATEEARLRMEESRRLSADMEARAKLLSDLERELASLEGERDEALLALQESRQTVDAGVRERELLKDEIVKREKSLADSLSEEERLCGELEVAHKDQGLLRRTVEVLTTERDTLARQVAELTAERAELLEARKALESVHRALSQATAGR